MATCGNLFGMSGIGSKINCDIFCFPIKSITSIAQIRLETMLALCATFAILQCDNNDCSQSCLDLALLPAHQAAPAVVRPQWGLGLGCRWTSVGLGDAGLLLPNETLSKCYHVLHQITCTRGNIFRLVAFCGTLLMEVFNCKPMWKIETQTNIWQKWTHSYKFTRIQLGPSNYSCPWIYLRKKWNWALLKPRQRINSSQIPRPSSVDKVSWGTCLDE